MSLSDLRLQVHPGDGIVGRLGSVVVLCLPRGEEQQGVAVELLDRIRAVADDNESPGPAIARACTELTGTVSFDHLPPVAVVSAHGDQLALLLHGAVRIELQSGGERSVLSGEDALAWLDRVVESGPLTIGGADTPEGERPVPPAWSDLAHGVVPGAGATLVAADAAPVPAAEPAAAEEGQVEAEAEPVQPEAVAGTVVGRLVVDDGPTLEVDGSYVLGREPHEHPDVVEGRAQPFVVPDPDRKASRAHALVLVDGDSVAVADLGSANGTHLARAGAIEWDRLEPGTATRLEPGDRVLIGLRILTFEQP